MSDRPAEPKATELALPSSARVAIERPVVRSWTTTELLGEAAEAKIIHGGETYRLLRTRNDKLLLIK